MSSRAGLDYLPHNGLVRRPSDDRVKTTRNRIGWEALLTPARELADHR
jgi:hypothetical protein